MTLYELTLEAKSAVSACKHPDISEWVAAIDPVLKAAGESQIGDGEVTSIIVGSTHLIVYTGNAMALPIHVLTAADPVREATLYRVKKDLAKAESALASAKAAVLQHAVAVKDLSIRHRTLLAGF